MERRTLGSSGTIVSAYALGTMTFGAETDEATAFAQCDRYLEAGGTLLDTADVYNAGESERIVGRWLADRGVRDDVLLATKARFPVGDDTDVNRRGLSRTWLTRAIDASLTRLGVDHVDLYQVHAWDPLTPPEEWLATLDDLVRAGKVGAVGVSNLRGYQLQRAVDVTRAEGLSPIVTLQPQWNLLARELEWELVPCCEAEGLGILPWSPLGGGWLTGKYRRDERPTGATRLGEDPQRGVEAWDKRATERTWTILDAVTEVADAHGATMSQVALAWVTAQPQVSSTILGARTTEQLDDCLGAAELTLDPAALERLDEVSAPVTPDYPYGFFDELDAGRATDAWPV
ncbi:aldo/keto reductase [Nitriliruptoraceae bacterium ZYF776]|nr:aldo/keto reductase [Profundirhabdus halotolerans]